MRKVLFSAILLSLLLWADLGQGVEVVTTVGGETITWDLNILHTQPHFIGCWEDPPWFHRCQYVSPLPTPLTPFTLEAQITPTEMGFITALSLDYIPYGDSVSIRDCPNLEISASGVFHLIDPVPPYLMQRVFAINFFRYESITIVIEMWFHNPDSTPYEMPVYGGPPGTHGYGGPFFGGDRPDPGKSKPFWSNVGGGPGKCGKLGLPKYWVNLSSLNLVVQDTDFAYKGLGPPVSLTRTYNSQQTASGMFGNGWTFAYESTIDNLCEGAQLFKGSGDRSLYKAPNLCQGVPPVTTTPPEGHFDVLTLREGDFWILQSKRDQLEYRYEFSGVYPTGFNQAVRRYRLISITDTSGNPLNLSYNPDGTLASLTDAVGRVTSFYYDGNRHCTSMTLPNGRTASFAYDAGGNLISTTDFAGTVTTYTYDANNYLTSLSSGGTTSSFTYSPLLPKLVQTVTDARGQVTTYSKSETTVTVTDPLGRQSIYNHTGPRLTHSRNPLNQDVHRFTYSSGQATEFLDSLGYRTQWEYDARGNLTSQTDAMSDETDFVYDLADNLTEVINAYDQRWRFEYDGNRRLTRRISPLGYATSFSYASNGRLIGMTDANGRTTSYTYDWLGNLVTLTDPLGQVTRFVYDAAGFDRTSLTDARGNIWRFSYDNNRRLTQITNPDGTVKRYTYDCCSPTGIIDENGQATLFQNDGELLIGAITDPLGHVTQYSYTSDKRMASVSDPLGRTTSFSYDPAGRLVKITDPLGRFISRTFDQNGNLSTVTDERGKVTRFFYDANNRIEQITDPLNRSVSFNRDGLGRITSLFNARFEPPNTGVVSFTYDDDGRRIAKVYNPTPVASYRYDNTNKLIGFTDSTGETTYTRDFLGRVTQILYPNGRSLSMAYDLVGNLTSLGYPNGLTVTYTYDNRNRVTGIGWGGNSITQAYDNTQNLLSTVRSNGTRTDYVYDANKRVVSITHASGAVPFAQLQYTRDANGAVTSETKSVPLSASILPGTTACTYNDANQIVSCGADTFTYDRDGNLTAITGGRTFNGVYDPENRLTAATRQGVTTSYTYGATGRRVRAAATGGSTRNYHHDRTGKLLYETDGNNQVTANFIYNGDHLVAMTTGAGATYIYHFDQLGNTVALTDGDGNVVGAYAYAPYGEILNQTGSLPNPFTFVGEHGVMDEGGGLFFMRNRYYDALTGRFFQKDPIGIKGGLNLYAYVNNNPVSWNDPKGLQTARGSRRFIDLPDGQVVPYDWKTYPVPPPEGITPESLKVVCYVFDKVIGEVPVLGTVYGLGKAGYYAYMGDEKNAQWELKNVMLGPMGLPADLARDAELIKEKEGEEDYYLLPEPPGESYHDQEIKY